MRILTTIKFWEAVSGGHAYQLNVKVLLHLLSPLCVLFVYSTVFLLLLLPQQFLRAYVTAFLPLTPPPLPAPANPLHSEVEHLYYINILLV